MQSLRCWIAVALIAVVPAFAASADDKSWFENFVNARGGCGNIHILSMDWVRIDVHRGDIDGDLFGKSLLQWSDHDIATAIRIYKDCEAKRHAAIVNTCVRGGYDRSRCERDNPVSPLALGQIRGFESGLRNIIVDARKLDNQRKTQRAARIELERAETQRQREQAEEETQRKQEQLREQAKGDREAAEEAHRFAEREEPKIAEAMREAEDAGRARQAAEQQLAEIRSRIEAAKREKREALAQSQQERQREAGPPLERPLGRAEPAPVRGALAFKPTEFGTAYNQTAVRLDNDQRAELRTCDNTEGEDTCQYKLTEYAYALVAGKPGGTTSTTILIIAGGDNAAMAALGFMNTMVVVIATVNPELTRRERGELFKQLLKTNAKDRIDGDARVGGVHYSLKAMTEAGLWLTVNRDSADVSSDELPGTFLGNWRGPDGAAIAIGPRSYTRPNSECTLSTIKSSGLASGVVGPLLEKRAFPSRTSVFSLWT